MILYYNNIIDNDIINVSDSINYNNISDSSDNENDYNNVDNNCNPHACQNVISGNWNSVGINQFHNNINGPPNNRTASNNIPITNRVS